jgi:threonine/homoserine/homoserine lactone efflux protein
VHTILSPVAGKVEDGDKAEPGGSTLVRAMVSTFVLTITNPATLIAFASMFASFRALVGGANSYVDAGFVVAGVVGGSAGWWLCLTSVIGIFHTRITDRTVRIINRGSGVLVALFGLAVLIHVVMKVFGLNG